MTRGRPQRIRSAYAMPGASVSIGPGLYLDHVARLDVAFLADLNLDDRMQVTAAGAIDDKS